MRKIMKQIIAFWASLWRGEKQEVTHRAKAHAHQAEQLQAVTTSLTEQVARFLQSTYEFRYNWLTEEVEFCPVGRVGEGFSLVGKRELNSFCLESPARRVSSDSVWIKGFLPARVIL